jgi:hypothetical protein
MLQYDKETKDPPLGQKISKIFMFRPIGVTLHFSKFHHIFSRRLRHKNFVDS